MVKGMLWKKVKGFATSPVTDFHARNAQITAMISFGIPVELWMGATVIAESFYRSFALTAGFDPYYGEALTYVPVVALMTAEAGAAGYASRTLSQQGWTLFSAGKAAWYVSRKGASLGKEGVEDLVQRWKGSDEPVSAEQVADETAEETSESDSTLDAVVRNGTEIYSAVQEHNEQGGAMVNLATAGGAGLGAAKGLVEVLVGSTVGCGAGLVYRLLT